MTTSTAGPFDPSRFDYAPRTRIVFGAGAIERLGALAAERAPRHVLLVTDPGVVAAGHVARAEASLAAAGVRFTRFAGVHENPTTRDVDACLDVALAHDVDLFIGLGGGSAIDTAKGANFLVTNGGAMEDYWGKGKATRPLLPLIAVPTTAGTGTEVQSFTLIERAADHQKMACGAASAAPCVALLDPELTLTQPAHVTASTGLDTVTHAVESFVTRARNAISSLYAKEAFLLANDAFPRVIEAPNDMEARGAMLLAAAFAGLAIENSMLGAAHSLANPLTARFRLAHGQAVGTMLPHVLEFNAGDTTTAALYAELAAAARIVTGGAGGAPRIAARLHGLLDAAGFPRSLAASGVTEDALDALATEAARQWTARFNPRAVGVAELRELYARALEA